MLTQITLAVSLTLGSGLPSVIQQTQTEDSRSNTPVVQREENVNLRDIPRASRDKTRETPKVKIATRSPQKNPKRVSVRTPPPKTPVKKTSPQEPQSGSGQKPTGLWLELAKCESGANLRSNTGNGFLGAYQFLPSTWEGYTGGRFGPVLEANWAEQTFVASRIWIKQGWGAFPGCGRKMGHPDMPVYPGP